MLGTPDGSSGAHARICDAVKARQGARTPAVDGRAGSSNKGCGFVLTGRRNDLPRDGPGNDRNSSESSGTRSAGPVPLRVERCRWPKRLDQTHNPSVAGSSPARPTMSDQGFCEVPVPLSHIGSSTCVPLFAPAPPPGRRWLRHVCPTRSTSRSSLIFTWVQPAQGGSGDAAGAVRG